MKNILMHRIIIALTLSTFHNVFSLEDRDRLPHNDGNNYAVKKPLLVENREEPEQNLLVDIYDEVYDNVKVYLRPSDENNNLRHKSKSKKSKKSKTKRSHRSHSRSDPNCDSDSDSHSNSHTFDQVKCSEDHGDDDNLPSTQDDDTDQLNINPPPTSPTPPTPTPPTPTPPTPTPPTPTPPTPTPPTPTPPTPSPPTGGAPGAGGCPATAFINEVHYQNILVDASEFVEVAYTSSYNLAGHRLFFYNSAGASYKETDDISEAPLAITNQAAGTEFIFTSLSVYQLTNEVINTNGGIALIGPNNEVIDFISYGIAITATSGPANNVTSTLMGVTEAANAGPASSLQLGGTGFQKADFTWQQSQRSTPGNLNTGQTILCPTGGTTPVRVNTKRTADEIVTHLQGIDIEFNSGD